MVRILEVILVEDKSKLQEQPTTLITGMMQTEINAEEEGLGSLPEASMGSSRIGQEYLWEMQNWFEYLQDWVNWFRVPT